MNGFVVAVVCLLCFVVVVAAVVVAAAVVFGLFYLFVVGFCCFVCCFGVQCLEECWHDNDLHCLEIPLRIQDGNFCVPPLRK